MELRRGLFHCHTEFSYDSALTFADYVARARPLGFQFVLLAEHSRGRDDGAYQAYRAACRAASSGSGVLFVPGIEYRTDEGDEIIAVGAEAMPAGPPLGYAAALEFFAPRSALLALPHPSAARCTDPRSPVAAHLHRFDAVEVVNAKRGSKYWPTADLIRGANSAIAANGGAVGLAGLDLHEPSGFSPILVCLDRPARDLAELAGAIRAGGFANRVYFHTLPSRGPYRLTWSLRVGGEFFRRVGRSRVAEQRWLTRPLKSLLEGARRLSGLAAARPRPR